jgi:Amt family ammonium transporter
MPKQNLNYLLSGDPPRFQPRLSMLMALENTKAYGVLQYLLRPAAATYWLACIPLTAIIVILSHSAVFALNQPSLNSIAGDEKFLKGSLNTLWVLIAAVLVIFMNAGFAMLETGFCRPKNAVNLLSKNLIVFALATLAYWATGFSLMFGNPDNGWLGGGGWFLSGTSQIYGLKPFPEGLPVPVFFLFSLGFAGVAATIVSGAVAERIKFIDFIFFSLLLVGIAYPITGHWIWGSNGWLSHLHGQEGGFRDFAGSTQVHSLGGWAALVGAAMLKPRLGKYSKNGRINAIPGHNMSIATLGCFILWIGWFGFNPGSRLAVDESVPYIAVTTNLAAAAGGVTATFVSWLKNAKPDLTMMINGILAGLVAITAGCDGVSYWGAVVIGSIAGILVVFAVGFFDFISIDDPVGALAVHLVNGIWGTFAVGLFNLKTGLFYGNGVQQLLDQMVGILVVGTFSIVFSIVVWSVLKSLLGIRVNLKEEMQGLDISEHAMEAYSGFVTEADVILANQVSDTSALDYPSRNKV